MRVIVEPGNPFDFDENELEELAEEIRRADSIASVDLAKRPEHGYGVTLIEVLNLYLEVYGATGTAWATLKAVKGSVEWLKRRWQKDREDNPEEGPRPRSLRVYDENGKLLGSVKIDEPDGEPTEEDGGEDIDSRTPPEVN
jgi:hypothetical protein